jgi:hypothetical protein
MGERLTSGFALGGVYTRRNICGNLEVYRPHEHLWTPAQRKAATTLAASGRQRRRENAVPKRQYITTVSAEFPAGKKISWKTKKFA